MNHLHKSALLAASVLTFAGCTTPSTSENADVAASENADIIWTQRGADIVGDAAGDNSGFSVSLSADGNSVAIGAPYNNGSGDLAGHVRVFAWDGSTWAQRGADIAGEAAYDNSGFSVSLSADGSIVAVGAPGNNESGDYAGHVRVFAWDGSTWTQRGADIAGEAAGDESGTSVSVSADGNIVAVGAPGNDVSGKTAGHVRVFAWDGSTWAQRGADIAGEAADDKSGSSVSLSSDGDTVAIGAPGNNESGKTAGHVRVFAWDGSTWAQRGADIAGEAAGDKSGSSVSLSSDGDTVAIDAPGNGGSGDRAGHVRVFAWDGSTWSQRGADIAGKAAVDRSGNSVSLSSDGNTVAIDALWNDGSGKTAGHVRVFVWDGSTWAQRGADIAGEAAGDKSGSSVSLSADGDTVAIGALWNDGSGDEAGTVRVFAWDGSKR